MNTKVPGLTLREATPADTKAVLSLIQQLATYEKLAHEVVTDEAHLRASLFAPDSVARAILAELHGKPVAFALFFYNFSTFLGRRGLYLEDLFVLPEQRNKGIGKVLLSYLAKIAHEQNCGRFEWSVLDWNTPAIDFYRKLGAQPMGDWTVFRLREDGIRKLAAHF